MVSKDILIHKLFRGHLSTKHIVSPFFTLLHILHTHLAVKDLVRKILTHNVKLRLDTIDMLTHKWNSQYASSTPAPIYAEAKHTIERCFNPPLAAHIRSMMEAPISSVQPVKTGLWRPAPGMIGLIGTKCGDAIHHSYR